MNSRSRLTNTLVVVRLHKTKLINNNIVLEALSFFYHQISPKLNIQMNMGTEKATEWVPFRVRSFVHLLCLKPAHSLF